MTIPITGIPAPRQTVALGDPNIKVSRALSAASNNATIVKASPGTLFQVIAINTTATIYYLKFYNVITTPAPATDTVVLTIPVLVSTVGPTIISIPSGLAFNVGIGFALVGAIGDTDNSNAATGVAINVLYK